MTLHDKEFAESGEDIWTPAARMATVGIFILLLGACLYIARPVLLPVGAAMVIGTTLAPVVKAAARYRASPWLTAAVIAVVLVAAVGAAATFLAKPVTDWVSRAPEIGAIKARRIELRAGEISFFQDGAREIGVGEVPAREVQTRQIREREDGPGAAHPAGIEHLVARRGGRGLFLAQLGETGAG